MITMYTIVNDEIVNRKFYRNNTAQTREHYISTLRRHYTGNYKMLELITEYRADFVNRNVLPYDDYFTFQVEEQYMDGHMFSDKFFSYNFDINSAVNLTILFSDDNYENRNIFINEIIFYLKNYGKYELLSKLTSYLEEFIYDDNQYIFVEEHKLSMRKEDS